MKGVLGTLRAEDRSVFFSCMTSGSSLSSSIGSNSAAAVFQAGIKDASIMDHLELHAGRLDSFDKMATEVSTVARSRNENDIVPMDVSVMKGKGGRGKGRQEQRW